MRIALAILSGFLFAFAFPDYSLGWLIFIALIPLFIALARARSWREGLLLGWISQTIAWLLMVPWVVRVMSHYGGVPLVIAILFHIALCLVLGLYGAAFGVIVFRISPGDNFLRWLLVPLAWAAMEYARTYLLTGFPWNLLGYPAAANLALLQITTVAGIYGLSFLVAAFNALVAWFDAARSPSIPRRNLSFRASSKNCGRRPSRSQPMASRHWAFD